jgi:predicted RNA-binding Zn ribbon-like protein
MNVQLDLFENNDELSLMKKEMALIADSNRRNHKAQFAHINNISKEIIKLREELDRLRNLQIKQVK